jgi:hypothetical protein
LSKPLFSKEPSSPQLKVIYGFLCNPGLENRTYREIAAETDVALGTVDWIMKELKETKSRIEDIEASQ